MTVMMRGSHGEHRDDRSPVRYSGTWEEFCELWQAYAQIERYAADKESGAVPFLSPFLLREGVVGKTKENIERCGAWFGIDIDAAGWTMHRLMATFADYPRVIHSTTKSTPDHQRWRVLVQLSRELAPDEHESVWHHFNRMVGGTIDPQTKNVNRVLFVPAMWQGAHWDFSAHVHGTPLDVERVDVVTPQPAMPVLTSLAGSPRGDLLTAGMEANFRAAPEGGRFFRLLLAMAYRAKEQGWQVSAAELEREALAFDRGATGKRRPFARREAAKALGIADAKGHALTALERVRKRLMKGAR